MSRVLVIAPSWVGDMVMAQTLFRRIVRMDPDAEIHVVGPEWSIPLTARMPEVTRAYVLDVPHGSFGFGARRMLGKALRPMAFDASFVMPRSWKSALVPFFAGVPRRIGYRGEMRFWLLNDIVPRRAVAHDGAHKPRTVDEFVGLADPSEPEMRAEEAPKIERDMASEAKARDAFSISDDASPVTMCPGAEAGPIKQWPVEHFATLASEVGKTGRPVWLLGSARDREDCERIAEIVGSNADVQVFAGRTSLVQAIDLIGMSAGIVSNDSGLMHVASAMRKPTVALYGPTSEKVNPPLSPAARIVADRPAGREPAMDRIEPADVLAALEDAGGL
ncbi:lipopolysaccharide heptosyltransferase II [Tepidamorphus sp. 3E244]|uniref:lipopolysaccharide heptosyltransferase II n=1 Tax=Tepidamorphus sp. 3E244 TaxID=3385498 RepID=UPI0038FC2C45